MRTKLRKDKILLYCFILFPYVRAEALVRISLVDTAYDLLKLLSFCVAFFLCAKAVIEEKEIHIEPFHIMVVGLVGVTFLSTAVHHANIMTTMIRYLPVLTSIFILKYVVHEQDVREFFRGAAIVFGALLTINMMLLLVKPNGLYVTAGRSSVLFDQGTEVYFLGKANALTPPIASMLLLVLVDDYMSNGKFSKRGLYFVVISILQIAIMKSGTGVIGMAVLMMVYFISRRKAFKAKSKWYVSYNLICILAVAMTFAVVVFQIQNLASFLIVDIMHKSLTLSNRTNVWAMMFDYFKRCFGLREYLIGSGAVDYKRAVFNDRYAHCHNQFFDQFIQSGFIGCGLFIGMICLAEYKVTKRYHKLFSSNLICYLAALIISLNIMFITEVYTTPLTFLILTLGYRNDEMIPSKCLIKGVNVNI